MIQINLLPVRKRKKRGAAPSARSFLIVYALSVALAASTIGYLWVSKNNEIKTAQTRLDKLKLEVKKYEHLEAALNDMKKEKELIEKRRIVIADLQKDRDKMVRVLALLGAEVPANRLWFDRMTQSGLGLTLEGVALSNETVAEFMKGLEASPYIEYGSVSLTHSRQTVINQLKLREFRLTFRFFPYSALQEKLKENAPADSIVAPTTEGKANG